MKGNQAGKGWPGAALARDLERKPRFPEGREDPQKRGMGRAMGHPKGSHPLISEKKTTNL